MEESGLALKDLTLWMRTKPEFTGIFTPLKEIYEQSVADLTPRPNQPPSHPEREDKDEDDLETSGWESNGDDIQDDTLRLCGRNSPSNRRGSSMGN